MSLSAAPSSKSTPPETFKDIFFLDRRARSIRVPDYQRAFSWERKQIDLFIEDLKKYGGTKQGYYFGHFIAEDLGDHWEIVDGQQRITTFVLFLMVCRAVSAPACDELAFSLIECFTAVSYDQVALKVMGDGLQTFLSANESSDEQHPPKDDDIVSAFSLKGPFTRSQRRMALALLRFYQAFLKGRLDRNRISDYIAMIMTADCSLHLPKGKAVAVNIFEMHNTRGMPLTTLEIVKAVLMKFVFDNGGTDRDKKVEEIQAEFGEIYGMEERMDTCTFRGKMSTEQALRLHLRSVDDGTKKTAVAFGIPAIGASSDVLITYVNDRLQFEGFGKRTPRRPDDAVRYALNLAKEFKKSVRIISQDLPAWDKDEPLVGDVLILERDLSCLFFLIVCRLLEFEPGKADGRLGKTTLVLWERLLFTRNFHDKYYNLKGVRDNFAALWEACGDNEPQIASVISSYLEKGFRPDKIPGLQKVVWKFMDDNRNQILKNAFYWWKSKMIYALYKYEVDNGANVRQVMKGSLSVEHILPQEWNWIRDKDDKLKDMDESEFKAFHEQIDGCINGIGNLLLITQEENTSQGNKHPSEKDYSRYYANGSVHDYKERWKSHDNWPEIISERGENILAFMRLKLVGMPPSPETPPVLPSQVPSGGLN